MLEETFSAILVPVDRVIEAAELAGNCSNEVGLLAWIPMPKGVEDCALVTLVLVGILPVIVAAMLAEAMLVAVAVLAEKARD